MYHSHLSGELARDRQREILASAGRRHLAQECRIPSTQPSPLTQSQQWLRHVLRITARFRRAARA